MRLMLLIALAACLAAQPPAIQPGPHHKQLDTLAGNWTVAVRFRLGNSQEMQATATCESKWILGGRFLEQQYKNNSGFEVLQFLGYDNHKKKFFEIKFDNSDTGVLHTEGAISDDGKVITNIGDRLDPVSGKAGRLRTATTLTDADHYTVEWFLTGDDGKEQRTVVMVHTRK